MKTLVDDLLSHKALTFEATEQLFSAMLSGELADVQIGAILAAWRLRGAGADELVAGAKVMRAQATPVRLPAALRPLVDNCGTGGDGLHSFNISTAAAIVAASAGARVAKHGNRSVSSRCGSADLLFAAGCPANLSSDATASLLKTTGFTFFFAPNFHPSLARVAAARQQLGVRTVFNLLGPLANPIGPELQLIGVGAPTYLRPMAEALQRLGTKRALVVHGRDGLDEISPEQITDAFYIEDGQLTAMEIDPKTLGVQAPVSALAGGDAEANLVILDAMLAGERPQVAQAVSLNAAAVLWLDGTCKSLAEGVALAQRQISSKVARDYFDAWLRAAKALAL